MIKITLMTNYSSLLIIIMIIIIMIIIIIITVTTDGSYVVQVFHKENSMR